jgi:UDP-3-O-[3-hydroxymyristoyl] glucosamine N-acyltransferase
VPKTLNELAALVGGVVSGDGDTAVSAARPLGEAGPGDISFLEKVAKRGDLSRTRASAVVAPPDLTGIGLPAIHVPDTLMGFITIFRHFHVLPDTEPPGIDPRAFVHPAATIGEHASIRPFASIGEGTVIGARCQIGTGAVIGRHCKIADDVTIHPNVVLYDGCVVGNRVIIHATAVIGADGFGYRQRGGVNVKVPQLGYVELGDDVEIGAGSAIDRSTFGVTRIGKGTKIDNLVQIAHNCQIGEHNILVSQCGIAGSSTTGDYVVMAGQAGILDHINVGKGVVIAAQAGVTADVKPGERMLGTPALPWRDFTQRLWAVSQLPEWRKELQRIKSKIGMTGKD